MEKERQTDLFCGETVQTQTEAEEAVAHHRRRQEVWLGYSASGSGFSQSVSCQMSHVTVCWWRTRPAVSLCIFWERNRQKETICHLLSSARWHLSYLCCFLGKINAVMKMDVKNSICMAQYNILESLNSTNISQLRVIYCKHTHMELGGCDVSYSD